MFPTISDTNSTAISVIAYSKIGSSYWQSHTINPDTAYKLRLLYYSYLSYNMATTGLAYIDGSVQERRNFTAKAVELRLSWINPSICQAMCCLLWALV